jgi:hypothetical protein
MKRKKEIPKGLKAQPWPKEPEVIGYDEWYKLNYHHYDYQRRKYIFDMTDKDKQDVYNDYVRRSLIEVHWSTRFKGYECNSWIIINPTQDPSYFVIQHFCGEKKIVELAHPTSLTREKAGRCDDCWSIGRRTPAQMEARKKFIRYYHAICSDGIKIEKKLKEDERKKHKSKSVSTEDIPGEIG